MTLLRLLGILVPRFVTEDWAIGIAYCDKCDEPHPQPICRMSSVEPGEAFDGISAVRLFTWLGLSVTWPQEARLRPWKNPHDTRAAA